MFHLNSCNWLSSIFLAWVNYALVDENALCLFVCNKPSHHAPVTDNHSESSLSHDMSVDTLQQVHLLMESETKPEGGKFHFLSWSVTPPFTASHKFPFKLLIYPTCHMQTIIVQNHLFMRPPWILYKKPTCWHQLRQNLKLVSSICMYRPTKATCSSLTHLNWLLFFILLASFPSHSHIFSRSRRVSCKIKSGSVLRIRLLFYYYMR